MTKPLPLSTEHVAPPEDLAIVLRAMGLGAQLAVYRLDGSPLTEQDRLNLPSLLRGYALGRELQPTDDEIAAAVLATSSDG